jgi:acyl-CoA thioesterase
MNDPLMRLLGMDGEVTAPGKAIVRATLKAEHLNNLGIAHGGFIYTLADAAFALASNSYDVPAVALATNIEYLQAGQPGDALEAIALEIHLGYRTGVYEVEVRNATARLAIFHGTVYRKQPHSSEKREAK